MRAGALRIIGALAATYAKAYDVTASSAYAAKASERVTRQPHAREGTVVHRAKARAERSASGTIGAFAASQLGRAATRPNANACAVFTTATRERHMKTSTSAPVAKAFSTRNAAAARAKARADDRRPTGFECLPLPGVAACDESERQLGVCDRAALCRFR